MVSSMKLKQYNFYTYNKEGIDCVIPVFAEDLEEAWFKFDRIYGENYPVDMVREGK